MGKIGLCFVNTSSQIEPDYVTKLAKKCEQIGLHSFWVIDRIAYDNLEPLSVLATAGAVTQRIRIGTSVLLAALRHPVLLAKTVSTLDILSAGRLTLGIGFGSRENDFTSVEVSFKGRGRRAEEAIALMKRLWTEERVTHRGKFYQVENTVFGPRPVPSPTHLDGGRGRNRFEACGQASRWLHMQKQRHPGIPVSVGKDQRVCPGGGT